MSNCHAITSFEEPNLYGPLNLDGQIEAYVESPFATRSLIRALSRLQATVTEGRLRYRQVNRVYGSFEGITIHPEDRPPKLFATEDENLFNSGGGGNLA